MGRVRATGTKPEMVVRRMVHAMGFRYRLHGKLPGRPDLVFASRKKVVFVHGCFWHHHQGCKLARIPKSRVDFWTNKLDGNKIRDDRVAEELERMGWEVLVVWECELTNLAALQQNLLEFLSAKRNTKT